MKLPDFKKRRKQIIIFSIFLVLIIIAVIVIRGLSTPSTGIVTMHPIPTTAAPQLVSVTGKTVRFQYPSSMHPITTNKLGSGEVENFSYISSQQHPWNLTMAVSKLPCGTLSCDGSYHFRELNPTKYSLEKKKINGLDVFIMTDTSGGYNKVAFIVHNNIDADIALNSSSVIDSNQLEQIFSTVLNSWHWL